MVRSKRAPVGRSGDGLRLALWGQNVMKESPVDAARLKQEFVAVFDAVSGEFDQGGVEFFGPMGRRLVELAAIRPGERVLDVGSGRGAVLLPAAAAAGPDGEAVGIDLAKGMVRHLTADIERRGIANASVRLMDGEAPDFPAASFDAVLGSFSIALLPNSVEALPRYRELLRPGGRLAFTSPALSPDGTLAFVPPAVQGLFEQLVAHMPPELEDNPFANPAGSWLAGSDRITRTLAGAGYSSVDIHDENVNLVTASGEEWVRWSKTTGMRMAYELLPEPEREALEARIAGDLEATRTADGPVEFAFPVVVVVARP